MLHLTRSIRIELRNWTRLAPFYQPHCLTASVFFLIREALILAAKDRDVTLGKPGFTSCSTGSNSLASGRGESISSVFTAWARMIGWISLSNIRYRYDKDYKDDVTIADLRVESTAGFSNPRPLNHNDLGGKWSVRRFRSNTIFIEWRRPTSLPKRCRQWRIERLFHSCRASTYMVTAGRRCLSLAELKVSDPTGNLRDSAGCRANALFVSTDPCSVLRRVLYIGDTGNKSRIEKQMSAGLCERCLQKTALHLQRPVCSVISLRDDPGDCCISGVDSDGGILSIPGNQLCNRTGLVVIRMSSTDLPKYPCAQKLRRIHVVRSISMTACSEFSECKDGGLPRSWQGLLTGRRNWKEECPRCCTDRHIL